MVYQVVDLLNTALVRCGQFFSRILYGTSMSSVFLCMLFLFFLSKFILKPIVGMAGKSDRARYSGDVDE